MEYWLAFITGGFICGAAQLLSDYKRISQTHVVIGLVVAGVILGGLGLYDRLVELAGMGALLPMSGFGYWLIKGIVVTEAEHGWMAAGANVFRLAGLELSVAIVLSFFTALICKPRG